MANARAFFILQATIDGASAVTPSTAFVCPRGASYGGITFDTVTDGGGYGTSVTGQIQGTNDVTEDSKGTVTLDDNPTWYDVPGGQSSGRTADGGELLGGADGLVTIEPFVFFRLTLTVDGAATNLTGTARAKFDYDS